MSDNQSTNPVALPAAGPTDAKAKPEKAGKSKPEGHQKPNPKPKPGHDAPKHLRPLHRYAGTVGQFAANPDGVLDRFQLETADSTHTVMFPPHFGQQLLALAQPGRAVVVLGFLKTTPKGDEHLRLASIDAAGTTIRPLPPTASTTDAATLSGTIAELLLDPKGHLRAVRLEGDATELRLPPHLGQQLADRLALGTAVVASGQRRPLRPGEVLAHPEAPVPLKLEMLTVGDESFLIH